MCQMSFGYSHRPQTRHEKLRADEVLNLQYVILLMTDITGVDPGHGSLKFNLHGIAVTRLLTVEELDELTRFVQPVHVCLRRALSCFYCLCFSTLKF